jgi:NTE family protein
MKYKNLVLSGGGLKGYYFIGALKYLYENNLLKPKRIIGVSIGAIIGYLLTIGYQITEISSLFLKISLDKYTPELVLDKLFEEFYCLDNTKIIKMLSYLTTSKNMNKLITLDELYQLTKIDFIVGTCNLTKKKYEFISHLTYPDLPAIIALQMSFSLPLIFKPVIYNNNIYVDGGVYNNYPINYLKSDIKKTIGIALNSNEEITDVFGIISSIIDLISDNKKIKKKYYLNTIFINRIENYNLLDFINIKEQREDMINAGFNSAKKFNEKIDFIEKIILELINKI